MTRTFEDLMVEAEFAPVDGWDFSWLDGRASEERPPWGYARSMGERMARATAALDIQTGGGEVLAEVPELARLTVATESWPPNLERATRLLAPRGVAVVDDHDSPPLPFAAEAFDLVVSRHPVATWWTEIARLLRPGGTYFSQQIGSGSVGELTTYFCGPQPPDEHSQRHPDQARAAAEAAGLEVVDLRPARLRMEFHDVGAVVYFLRKVVWTVPDFSVERYRAELAALHDRIQAEGPFVAHATRFLIEARKLENLGGSSSRQRTRGRGQPSPRSSPPGAEESHFVINSFSPE